MGSADGVEVSKLIGFYMITLLMEKFNNSLFGIYGDDGQTHEWCTNACTGTMDKQ